MFGNQKAKYWIQGRKNVFKNIQTQIKENERRIWIHAASLGEFEQGRPLIEKIKSEHPEYKIFLTFFSPSGYEVRKNYAEADYIYYLPSDTPANAKKFVDLVKPEKVLFIKYEYWYNYLSVLDKRKIPVYLCSAIFRDNQLFFKWYGSWYRRILSLFTYFFVQTESSMKLLASIGISTVTITGDTRFDRVFAIASQTKEIDDMAVFVNSQACLIAGSTWEPDEDLLAAYINQTSLPLKYIIAPHEIHESHIARLEKSIQKKVVRFSVWNQDKTSNTDVLIIDNIGMLSSLYRYGQVAYIGGGFGKGIHNTLEAATFGLPVLFGPNHLKFQEATDLINSGAAFSIENIDQLRTKLSALFENPALLKESGHKASDFVRRNIGASDKIMARIMVER